MGQLWLRREERPSLPELIQVGLGYFFHHQAPAMFQKWPMTLWMKHFENEMTPLA